ncbi:Hypothetical predicted protein [Pelobates cultripes]|uniref:Uncharacterized protein n=1 Tax=Pelobates cultripes TaxID=61616 RepID=A0AAD1VZH3_PELCU|nr:Hypothetical predicted protein [Pelobates cultripes]
MAAAMCGREKGRLSTPPLLTADTMAHASRHCHEGEQYSYYLPQQPSKLMTTAAAQGGRNYPVPRPQLTARTEQACHQMTHNPATLSLPPPLTPALRGPSTPQSSCSPGDTSVQPIEQQGWTVCRCLLWRTPTLHRMSRAGVSQQWDSPSESDLRTTMMAAPAGAVRTAHIGLGDNSDDNIKATDDNIRANADSTKATDVSIKATGESIQATDNSIKATVNSFKAANRNLA